MKTQMQRPMAMIRALVITLAIIAHFACEHQESTYQPMLDIHGVLRNDYEIQRVILSRTYSMDEPEYFDLEDAQIILSGCGLCDTMIYHGHSPQGGVFETWPFIPEPRTTYQVIAYADGYDTLFGQTTTPGNFEIIQPSWSDTVDLNDTIVFSASEGAREYQIACVNASQQYFYWVVWPSAEPESLFKVPLSIFSTYVDEGDYEFMVFACDSNYFDYEYLFSSEKYPQCGITGGIGLFGSMWVKFVSVYIVQP